MDPVPGLILKCQTPVLEEFQDAPQHSSSVLSVSIP